jgi:hypothetical protein
MTPENGTPLRTIDVTGLSDNAVETIEAIVGVLQQNPASAPAQSSGEAWTARFEDWMREVAQRANRYPEGFTLDDSRESIYSGRDE